MLIIEMVLFVIRDGAVIAHNEKERKKKEREKAKGKGKAKAL